MDTGRPCAFGQTEHHRPIEAFWDPRAPSGEAEALEAWDPHWSQADFYAWCRAPRVGRYSWHTELHRAAGAKQQGRG